MSSFLCFCLQPQVTFYKGLVEINFLSENSFFCHEIELITLEDHSLVFSQMTLLMGSLVPLRILLPLQETCLI